jgi:hypothetical protein
MQRLVWTTLAITSAASPSYAEVLTGRFRVIVTEGTYSSRSFDTGETSSLDLTGKPLLLSWMSLSQLDVPSPSRPSEIVGKLFTNSARLSGVEFDFGSSSTNDPFHDPGSAFITAGYSGSAMSGTFNVGQNQNDGYDSFINFVFDSGMTNAIGSGSAFFYDDSQDTFNVRLKFTILSGQAFAAVPEPASWAMMIAGFGLLGAAARRRTRPNTVFA